MHRTPRCGTAAAQAPMSLPQIADRSRAESPSGDRMQLRASLSGGYHPMPKVSGLSRWPADATIVSANGEETNGGQRGIYRARQYGRADGAQPCESRVRA